MHYYKTTPRIKALTGTRKKTWRLHIIPRQDGTMEHHGIVNTASYWDGGSKTCYRVYSLNKLQWLPSPPIGGYPTFDANYYLEPGTILVETGVFCGKTATASITVHEDDIAQLTTFVGGLIS